MAENSKIEWTDATWNPITGCSIVDAGCTNCYAMALAGSRLRNHPSRAGLTRVTGGRAKWTGEVRLNEQWLDQPLRWTRPRMIFVCAHGDLFHPAVPDEWIDRVFAVMALAPQHTFQVLTKRPERAREYLSKLSDEPSEWRCKRLDYARMTVWPLPNVWLGASVSDQSSADLRIPHLLAAPAAVRFLSVEPMLGPVDLRALDVDGFWWNSLTGEMEVHGLVHPRLDWVICGGESGPGARPMHPDWARSLRDQCQAAGVAFHFKQWGEFVQASHDVCPDSDMSRNKAVWLGWDGKQAKPYHTGLDRPIGVIRIGKRAAGRLLDGREWNEMPRRDAVQDRG